MKTYDRKKLWSRSGNICCYPGCNVELVQERRTNRVVGEEAHIKGEKPLAPRYDSNLTSEERTSYENRILLCPNHHVEIDSDPEEWTVNIIQKMKHDHEEQVKENWRYPELLGDLKELVQRFEPTDEYLDSLVSGQIGDSENTFICRIDASVEEGVNTDILVCPGQKIIFFARGLISYDKFNHFTTPAGIICNEYGLPLAGKDSEDRYYPVVFPHQRTYLTDGGKLGFVGSLFGWINQYSEESSFFIGAKKEITVTEKGYLFLAVNDVKGAYGDNDGEFRVDIQVIDDE